MSLSDADLAAIRERYCSKLSFLPLHAADAINRLLAEIDRLNAENTRLLHLRDELCHEHLDEIERLRADLAEVRQPERRDYWGRPAPVSPEEAGDVTSPPQP